MAALRRGEWRGDPLPALGHDPRGKTLGILGMGGIGRNMAEKMRAFGMKIRYHNRTKLDPEHEEGAEYVDFETLLKESDVLSLNLPLNVSLSSFFFSLIKYKYTLYMCGCIYTSPPTNTDSPPRGTPSPPTNSPS